MKKNSDKIFPLNLGELKSFNSDFLFNSDNRKNLDAFILSLALAHTHFRNYLLYLELIEENVPKPPKKNYVNARFGAYSGMKWFVYKKLISSIEELIVLIEKNSKVVESKDFQNILSSLKPKYSNTWSNLLSLARGKINKNDSTQLKKIRNKITSIRDNISNHFSYHTLLAENYTKTFKNKKIRSDSRAFYTFGDSLEKTNFLFVEAAVEQTILDAIEFNFDNPKRDVLRLFIESAHVAISQVINTYLNNNTKVTTLGHSTEDYPVLENK